MTSSAPIPWLHVRNVLVLFAPLWCGAALLFGVAGGSFALLSKDLWSARQPLVVRDEAANSADRLGRFESQSDLKAAQETILEMAQNPEVVAAAMRQIGPPEGVDVASWPTAKQIDSTATRCVNILAPKGSEFGNSDVIYLQVNESSRQRSSEFCLAMFDSLTEQLRSVRRVRADSVIAELTHARDLSKRRLDESSSRIHEIEVQFGTDLGELRNLNDTISGDGTNRRTLEQTTSKLQAAQLELDKLQGLRDLLAAGSENPQHLLISGGDLLASQPSLQRLKDGLIDAQLAASRVSGIYTAENPKHRAAVAAEKEILRRMQQESIAVMRAMDPTIRLAREQVDRLGERRTRLSERLDELARARTDYAKIDDEVKHHTRQLAEAEQALSEAQASRSAALSTNLIAELGPPQVTDKPIGPGGAALTLGSTVAGLVFGFGAVFLVAPGPSEIRGRRRWSDYLSGGRRATDEPPKNQRRREDAAAGTDASSAAAS
jgi:succinoglycan biosynthesis transport protein ExoP